jgi:hypothetical protein
MHPRDAPWRATRNSVTPISIGRLRPTSSSVIVADRLRSPPCAACFISCHDRPGCAACQIAAGLACKIFDIIPATGLFRQLSPEGIFSGECRTRRHILGGIIRGVVKRPKTQSLGGRKRINMRREVANAKALGSVIASPSSAVLTLKRGESATLAALRRALVFSLAHA